MVRAFIGVGSNINPAFNVREALKRLANYVKITNISTVYLSKALDSPEQPSYYNCVVEIETGSSPEDLKRRILRPIEQGLERVRSKNKFAPRTIDLDLILYDDLVIENVDITLPDPEISLRPFLAIPLKEIDPELKLPGSGMPIAQIASKMSAEGIARLVDYTEFLKKEIFNGIKSGKD